MMVKRYWKKFVFSLLICLAISVYFLHFQLPKVIVQLQDGWVQWIYSPPTTYNVSPKENLHLVWMTNSEGLKLSGLWSNASTPQARGTIIMLHGIRAYKEVYLEKASELNEIGFHVLMIDHRAHGQSEGKYCTFGAKEKYDVSAWIDFLLSEQLLEGTLGIWGQSLGGAIAVQSMENDKRIAFGIIESTFVSYNLVVNDYASRLFPFFPFTSTSFNDYLAYRGATIAEFDAKEIYLPKKIGNINRPILLVHGADDQRISAEYFKQNANALKHPKSEFYLVPNANHLNVWQIGGESYRQKYEAFLEKQFNPSP